MSSRSETLSLKEHFALVPSIDPFHVQLRKSTKTKNVSIIVLKVSF
ncbi:hypothetical protein LEP1GSC172_1894 [Leptospira noguchii]|uniref:Uncharacterized protein n=1 Tax=Leptospira noguchii TaxID=28182 RepID=M6VV36_9LEPT|nr:hypothetical protein LEP1GSC172_1894 [Leptospira noguchii]